MIRGLVRRGIRRLGYEVNRYEPDSSAQAQRGTLLARFGIDLVLDVGANQGQYGRELRAHGYRGRIVSFEPLAAAHRVLAAAAAADPPWIAERTAIGEAAGEIVINVAGNSVSSSALPMLPAHLQAAPHSAFAGRETAPLATLDDAAAAWLAPARAPFLKIDTQGYEATVLAGAPATLARAVVVELEMSLTPLYEGQGSFDALHAVLRDAGFDRWGLWPAFTDLSSGRMLQVDGVYARSDRVRATS